MGTQLTREEREGGSREEEERKVKRPMIRKEMNTRIPVAINRDLLKLQYQEDYEKE